MELTRFYKKKPIEAGHIRAIRDVLQSTFDWRFAHESYSIYYPSQFYSLKSIHELDALVAKHGQPRDVLLAFSSSGGRMLNVETRLNDRISIRADNKSDPPEKLLDALQPVFSLELVGEIPGSRQIRTAFIAHGFTEEGLACANELSRFLTLLEIKCYSGRAFSPARVSDKVTGRLGKHDAFFALVTPQDDHTWITQEIATAKALNKPLFILKRMDVVMKEGILGDQEYIPFADSNLSKTFIPILEGLIELRGVQDPLHQYADLSTDYA